MHIDESLQVLPSTMQTIRAALPCTRWDTQVFLVEPGKAGTADQAAYYGHKNLVELLLDKAPFLPFFGETLILVGDVSIWHLLSERDW